MNSLRNRFERFCFRNRSKGIPRLMLWVIIANAVVFLINYMDPSGALYQALYFDREAILQGQVWRLFSFIFLDFIFRRPIWVVISILFYLQIGQALENSMGTLRFNLYYLTGMLFLAASGMIFDVSVTPFDLHTSLFLAYATLYPETQFLVFFIIPIKARWLGIANLALYLWELLQIDQFPLNLIPLFALANYLLHFGKDMVNIFPMSWRINADRLKRRKGKHPKAVPFPTAGSFEATATGPKAPYTHRCTICGRTNVTDPDLEFRYCSKCKGYYCYCLDHINNHTHIE